MAERPIIFSGEMVRAILDGRKTQTRRVIKPQPYEVSNRGEIAASGNRMPGLIRLRQTDDCLSTWEDACPYGRPGDRLWVRETWATVLDNLVMRSECDLAYRATDPDWSNCDVFRWRPSIHMPRWACRLTLEITDVRVERLQDISEQDAEAEGAEPLTVDDATPDERELLDLPLMEDRNPYRNGFAVLWDSINGKRPGCDWQSNPFVWAVTFRRCG